MIINELQKLESRFKVKSIPEFGNLVNFSTRDYHPIHRWFFYREAYSPELIYKVFEKYNVNKNDCVIDPFCGGGTTLLSSSFKEIPSFGIEINPFSYFLAYVKTRKYTLNDIEKIKNYIVRMRKIKKSSYNLPLPKLSILDKLFDKEVLDDIMKYKEFILKIENNDKLCRDFLFLGWLSILEGVSNYKKGGNGLKRKRRDVEEKNVADKVFSKLDSMVADLEYGISNRGQKDFYEPDLILGNTLSLLSDLKNSNKNYSLSIFSPPYLNCFDYFEIYKIELWMGDFVKDYSELRKLRRSSLISHLNADYSKKLNMDELPLEIQNIANHLRTQSLWDKRIPKMIEGYFCDMRNVLKNLYEILSPNSHCVIVVGNSAYTNMVVPVDLLLSSLAEDVGFRCEYIGVARKNETSSQQHSKLKDYERYLRESLVFLKRN